MSKVMLIDDDKVVVGLLETLLEMEGYDVVTHTGGENIVEVVQRANPDLVLIDVYLDANYGEGVDGFKLLSLIREQTGLKNTKIIMSSGIDFHIESESKGADGFIHKPYMPDELIDLIKQLL